MAAILGTCPLVLSPPALSVRLAFGAPRRSTSPVLSVVQRDHSKSLQLRLFASPIQPLKFPSLVALSSPGEATETESAVETPAQDNSVEEDETEDAEEDGGFVDQDKVSSVLMASLQSYKEALANDDMAKVSELEAFLQSIEDEKNSLETKLTSLTQELAAERERILRISADFDNFRKRTERERLSLMTNVQGEVVESLLPVLDNFERAKAQIKVETEGEEKIKNSYQSICKQFVEILTSLGVEAVETVGKEFDPMVHEAIMREESTEFEEGIVIQEFRKGFKIGERLLRPSMVKVSAGPGPVKPEDGDAPLAGETSIEDSGDQESIDESDDSP